MDLQVQADNFKGLKEFEELIPVNNSVYFGQDVRMEIMYAQPASLKNCAKSHYTILVLPGGGYEFCSYREGRVVAQAFTQQGFNAVVLYYSVKIIQEVEQDHQGLNRQPLDEVANVINLLRTQEDYGLKDTKIVVCGFSAGGHLAACMCNMFEDEQKRLGLTTSLRPDGAILAYPVISADPKLAHEGSFYCLTASKDPQDWAEFSCEKLVTPNTPPAFIWHTAPDTTVPVGNSIAYAQALWAKGCKAELMIYPEGEHGSSLAIDGVEPHGNFAHNDPYRATWLQRASDFVRNFI